MKPSTRKTSQQDPFDSRQWQSQSTIAAKAVLAKVTNSGSGAPPPPPGVSLTVTPGILCCGVGKKLTATAKATGPGAKNADVTLTWPGGTKTRKGSVTQVYTVQTADCGTVLEFTGTANGQTKTEKVPVVKLTTETFVSVLNNRARKKLGVGEEVYVTLTPSIGTVSWTLVGKGALQPTLNLTLFTAPDRATTTTVKGTLKTTAVETGVPKQITCSVEFEIFEPSGVKMDKGPGSDDFHVNGTGSAGFCATVYILPETVSFYRVLTREGFAPKQATFWFTRSDFPNHPAGQPAQVKIGTEQHPNVLEGPDMVRFGGPPPFNKKGGTILWAIPWFFKVIFGKEKKFATINQRGLATPTGTVTTSKAGYSVTRAVPDQTSGTHCPP